MHLNGSSNWRHRQLCRRIMCYLLDIHYSLPVTSTGNLNLTSVLPNHDSLDNCTVFSPIQDFAYVYKVWLLFSCQHNGCRRFQAKDTNTETD